MFTRTNGPGGWQGVFFNQNPPGSEMVHCRIENSTNSGIRIYKSAPSILNCTIANNSSPKYGGGIAVTNDALEGGDLTLVNCKILSNTTQLKGAGIYAVMGANTLTLSGCSLSQNTIAINQTTLYGAGLFVRGNSVLMNCSVSSNWCHVHPASRGMGAGIYALEGNTVLNNCVINGNYTVEGVFSDSGSLNMTNCIVIGHTPSVGIDVNGGVANVVNCTVAHNYGYGVFSMSGSINIINSILFFNNRGGQQYQGYNVGSESMTYSCVEGGFPGEGNIAFDPVLESVANPVIVPGSPCIDAGNPGLVFNDSCRPPALGTVRNDMGAYGGPGACGWPVLPRIVVQPKSLETCIGRSAAFSVGATGDAPLGYQWRFHGADGAAAPTAIAAATNATFSIANVQPADGGYYSVMIFNAYGAATSSIVSLTVRELCFDVDLYAGLTINAVTGRTYRVEYVSQLAATNDWILLTNIFQAEPSTFWLDPTPATRGRRFYRVVP